MTNKGNLEKNAIPFDKAMKLLIQGKKVDWYHEKNKDVLSLFLINGVLYQEVAHWLAGEINGVPTEMILEGYWIHSTKTMTHRKENQNDNR